MTTIPTLQEIKDNLMDDLEAEFGIAINPLTKAFLVGLSGVLAAFIWLLYLGMGDLQKNIWFDTADSVANGGTLERFGRNILGRDPYPATAAEYTCTVTGSTGGTIPANAVFKADDTSDSPGALYQIKGGAYTLSGSSGSITIVALAGGLATSLNTGNTLTCTTPLTNVNGQITITAETVAPIDAETIEEYRSNIADKVKLEPGSWSAADYRIVGLNVTGVKEVYAYGSQTDVGVVDVYLQGATPVASPGPSVSAGVISDYQTALEAVLPLDVWDVNYASCPINDIVVTITMGTFPTFSVAQKTAILTALQDFVNNVHPFIASTDDIATRNDVIATYNLSSTISAAVPGYGFSSVSFTVAGTPQTYWKADNGQIPYLNTTIIYA